MKRLTALFIVLVGVLSAAPWAPTSSQMPPSWVPHLTNGTGTGVPGGIPSRPTGGGTTINVTLPPYNADNTGASDASGAIGSAIAAASSGDVVYLPAGTYRINSGIGFRNTGGGNTPLGNNVTIKGDGLGESGDAGLTKLDVRAAAAFYLTFDPAYSGTVSVDMSTLTKGSSTVTVSDASGFSVGRPMRIKLNNSTAADLPVFEVYGLQSQIRFFDVIVTGKSGNNLTVRPQIHADFSSLSGATAQPAQYDSNIGVGIEDLWISGENSGGAMLYGIVWGPLVQDSWIKNVKISGHQNYGINAAGLVNCEIDWSRVELPYNGAFGTNHSGLLVNTANGILVWNSILIQNEPNIELNSGVVGSAFLYNYVDSGIFGLNLDINHGPWNSHNLYEGNYTPSLVDDAYFGGSSQQTIFRNFISALPNDPLGPTATQSGGVNMNRFGRYHSVVGNVMLAPGYDWSWMTTNGFFWGYPFSPYAGTGEATPSAGDWWKNWNTGTNAPRQYPATITAKNSSIQGVATFSPADAARILEWITEFGGFGKDISTISGMQFITPQSMSGNDLTFNGSNSTPIPWGVGDNIIVVGGPIGFWEIDHDAFGTATQLQNYNFRTNSIPDTETLPGGTTLGNSLAGFTTLSPPARFAATGKAFPPYDPSNSTTATASSISNLPAGARFLATVAPEVTAASIDTTGTILTIVCTKPVSPAGGTGGFTTTAPDTTLIFSSVSGSTIIFTLSKAVTAGLGVDVTYTSATGRWEDEQGNDLLSKTAFHATNLSSFTASKRIYWSFDPELVDGSTAVPGPGYDRFQPVTVGTSGIADAIIFYVDTNPYGGNLKIGVYDSSYNLVSQYVHTVDFAGENQFFTIPGFSVTPQTYWVGFQSADNNSPFLGSRTNSPGALKTQDATTPYADFPPSTITPAGTFNYDFLVGIEVIPNTSANVTNLTVGTIRAP